MSTADSDRCCVLWPYEQHALESVMHCHCNLERVVILDARASLCVRDYSLQIRRRSSHIVGVKHEMVLPHCGWCMNGIQDVIKEYVYVLC